MQTLTIKIDDNYLEQFLDFLQQIPKNKREVYQHTKLDILSQIPIEKKDDDFLNILKNGPTISEEEAQNWESSIKKGYKSWMIEEF